MNADRLMTASERELLRAQLLKTNYAQRMGADEFEKWFANHVMKPLRHVEKADAVPNGIVRSVLVDVKPSTVSANRIIELMNVTARRSGIYRTEEFEKSSWYRVAQFIAHSRALWNQYLENKQELLDG
jgi:hypothetical protein